MRLYWINGSIQKLCAVKQTRLAVTWSAACLNEWTGPLSVCCSLLSPSATHCLLAFSPHICPHPPTRHIPAPSFLAVDVRRKWDSEHGSRQQQWHCRMRGCRRPNAHKVTVCCHQPANLTAASHTSPLFSCAVPIFFSILPQIKIILLFIKNHFNTF